MSNKGNRIVVAVAIAVVAAAVVAGLILTGSPTDERMRRLDMARTDDLRAIHSAVRGYWRRHDRLPEALSEFAQEPDFSPDIRDPESDEVYPYRRLDSTAFELCAVFSLPSIQPERGTDFWFHGAGRQCFFLEVDKADRSSSPLRPNSP
ncbi:MAG: hypothetical protein R3282_05300 [Rhodothermales bacterium]|nr:hypothetical protein [Rhodothermales bacterium]